MLSGPSPPCNKEGIAYATGVASLFNQVLFCNCHGKVELSYLGRFPSSPFPSNKEVFRTVRSSQVRAVTSRVVPNPANGFPVSGPIPRWITHSIEPALGAFLLPVSMGSTAYQSAGQDRA